MIHLTDSAVVKIKKIFKEKELSQDSAIRFSVKGGGCNGFAMDIKLEPTRKFEMPEGNDCKFISNGVRILVDKKSLVFLNETTVDFIEENFGHKFIYNNPNATSWCGCNKSFNV